MQKKYIPVILLFIIGCSNNGSVKVQDQKEILVDTFPIKLLVVDTTQDEGWGADMKISIFKISKTDSSISYFLNSTSEKGNVGFQITMPTSVPEDKKATAQTMAFNSSGEISDNFIILLSRLYKQKSDTTLHFVDFKKTSFIDLDEFAKKQFGQAPNDPTGTKGLKVFFESENENDYGELYININEKEKWMEIKEKDEDYRKQVLKAWTIK